MSKTMWHLSALPVALALSVVVASPAAAQEPAAPAGTQESASPAPPVFDQVHYTPPPPGAGGPTPPPPTESPEPPSERTPMGAIASIAKAQPGASGWIGGEGFILKSDDDLYRLRIGMQTAYKVEPTYQAGDFQDRRAFFVLRPIFAGNIYKTWIRFWTSLELNSNPPYLLDSYVEVQPMPELGVRVGQQYTLISRHEQFGPQQILFPEWAPVAEYFWTGRDKGVTVWGLLADAHAEYYAGLYAGSPLRQFTNISGNYVVEARLVWNPLGAPGSTEYPYVSDKSSPFRISGSLQGYQGKVQLAEENFNPSTFRFEAMTTGTTRKQLCGAADVFLQSQWFAATAEGYYRHTDPETVASGDTYDSVGVWGQIGVLIWPHTMDVGLRFNWLDPSVDLDNDTFVSGEAQVAYYVTHSPNLVVKLRYGIGRQQSPGMDALGAVTLITKQGNFQLATAQLNLAF